jgi:hypothetical protein
VKAIPQRINTPTHQHIKMKPMQSRSLKFASYLTLSKRNVVLFVIGVFVMGMAAYITFIFTMIFVSASMGGPEIDYEKIEKEGTLTTGVVTDIAIQYNTSINGKHPITISYNYVVDGDTIESETKVLASSEVDELSVGDEVEVKYLGRDSVINDLEPFRFPFEILFYVAGSIAFVGLSLILFALINTLSRASILKNGRVVEATLVSINRKSPFANEGTVIYQYDTSRGAKVTGSSKTKDLLPLLDKKTGDPIKIFVGKNNENKSTLIPAAEVERNRWVI